jgi:Na+/H+-dicarboxylate symporter
VPTSIFDALAKNEILQIVVFSLFVGTAVASLDNKAPQILELAEQGAQIMLKVTNFVMKLAPLAIFCALASTIADQGLSMLAGLRQVRARLLRHHGHAVAAAVHRRLPRCWASG